MPFFEHLPEANVCYARHTLYSAAKDHIIRPANPQRAKKGCFDDQPIATHEGRLGQRAVIQISNKDKIRRDEIRTRYDCGGRKVD